MPVTVRPAHISDLPAIGELYGSVCDALAGKPYNPGWARDGFPTIDCAREYLNDGAPPRGPYQKPQRRGRL